MIAVLIGPDYGFSSLICMGLTIVGTLTITRLVSDNGAVMAALTSTTTLSIRV